IVDIGFDYCLVQAWPQYSDTPLPRFARACVERARAEWPAAVATPAPDAGLAQALASYGRAQGLQRALDSVDRRLRRPSPLPRALPALQAQQPRLQRAFDEFFPQLCAHAQEFQRTVAVPRTLSSWSTTTTRS
ncbi:MAG TPA: acyl carrier protein phosphodiesterase, partial [Salinisphaeraceae bacterium]|nr:acyl carrier protein phosphodiesterase [Salinisphaeraceae bacterium]